MNDVYVGKHYKVVCDTEEGVIGMTPDATLYNYKVVNIATGASEALCFTLPDALQAADNLDQQLHTAIGILPGIFFKKPELKIVRHEETLN